ncbi:hypothetical protein L1987_73945 [Smallanthus sonchifolius]|uniref:Uncharacterized protein n=1 Tax=Smallanthus sonchifolius TaxID=185202 RepID=A0ACB9A5S9_9ASTR|nr:hypothetical protein L1987_73945 [Smallanthus sonchifolius]
MFPFSAYSHPSFHENVNTSAPTLHFFSTPKKMAVKLTLIPPVKTSTPNPFTKDGGEEFLIGKHDTCNRLPSEQGFFRRRWTPRFVTVIRINFVLHSLFASVERSVRIEDGSCSDFLAFCLHLWNLILIFHLKKNLTPKLREEARVTVPKSLFAGEVAGISSTICTYPS